MTEIQSPPQRDIPAWLVMTVLIASIAGGGVFTWWMLRSSPDKVTVNLSTSRPSTPRGTMVAPGPRPVRPVFRGYTPPPLAPLPQASDPGPTWVTLDLKNTKPETAFAQLSKQAGLEIWLRDSGNVWEQLESKLVTTSSQRQPFWAAFFDLCKQTGLYPEVNSESPGKIYLAARPTGRLDGQGVSSGSFYMVASQVEHRSTVDFMRSSSPDHNVTVRFTLFAEPKLPVLMVPNEVTLEAVTDETGNSLSPTGPRRFVPDYSGASWMATVSARLGYPPGSGQRIAKIKGYATVVLCEKSEDFVIESPLTAGPTSKVIQGAEFQFKGLKKQTSGSGLDASFAINMDAPFYRVFRDYSNYSRQVRLSDAQGRTYGVGGSGTGGGGPGVFAFNIHFYPNNNAGAPAKLVATVPLDMKEIRVPFEFTDLPLP